MTAERIAPALLADSPDLEVRCWRRQSEDSIRSAQTLAGESTDAAKKQFGKQRNSTPPKKRSVFWLNRAWLLRFGETGSSVERPAKWAPPASLRLLLLPTKYPLRALKLHQERSGEHKGANNWCPSGLLMYTCFPMLGIFSNAADTRGTQ